uniref:Uncharacterized protein n=1 Tax=Rhizophora mucronata TaxID=61149 RepID=A0A2P2JRU5_RHIMU
MWPSDFFRCVFILMSDKQKQSLSWLFQLSWTSISCCLPHLVFLAGIHN